MPDFECELNKLKLDLCHTDEDREKELAFQRGKNYAYFSVLSAFVFAALSFLMYAVMWAIT